MKHVIARERERAGWKEGREGKPPTELRESEIPVGMVPVICVMVPGL